MLQQKSNQTFQETARETKREMKNGGGGNVKPATLVEQSNTNTTPNPNPNPRRIRGWAGRGREIARGEEESKGSDSPVGAFLDLLVQ